MEVAQDQFGRKVIAYNTNNTEFIKHFIRLRDSEKQILQLLQHIDNLVEDQNEKFVYIDLNLPAETIADVTRKLNQLQQKNNYLYPQLINTFNNINNTTFRTKIDVINGFSDVFDVDRLFMNLTRRYDLLSEEDRSKLNIIYQINVKDEYDKYCLYVTDENNYYYGCVWIFMHPNYPYIGMYGLRSTILRTLLKDKPAKYKGIAKLIMTGVKQLAKLNNKNIIIVPWPLPAMIIILKNMGFTEHNEDSQNMERTFLSPFAGTSNYYTFNIKLVTDTTDDKNIKLLHI